MLTFANEMPRELLVELLDDEILANVVGPDAIPDDLFAQYAAPNPYRYFILVDEVLVGELTFCDKGHYFEVGFWVRPEYRGQRIIQRAWAEVYPRGEVFKASCWAHNESAKKLLGHLGFLLTGSMEMRTGGFNRYKRLAIP